MIGYSDEQWVQRYELHFTGYPFFRRVPFTHLSYWLAQVTGWHVRVAHFVAQYILLAIASVLFYKFLKYLGWSALWALAGLALFHTAYPILQAFVEPVHTWDDIWCYCWLILGLFALFRRKLIVTALAFTAAVYAREQTLSYFPVYAAGIWLFGSNLRVWQRLALMVAPLAAFAPFFIPGWQVPQPTDYISDLNWGSAPKAANSLFSLIMSFGVIWLMWILGLVAYVRAPRQTRSLEMEFLVWGSLVTVALTLIVVMSVGFIRETRLLFPPFIFMIPLSLLWLRQAIPDLLDGPTWRLVVVALFAVVGMAIAIPEGNHIMPHLDYRNCPKLCQYWLGAHIGLAAGIVAAAAVSGSWARRKPAGIDA